MLIVFYLRIKKLPLQNPFQDLDDVNIWKNRTTEWLIVRKSSYLK